VLARGDRRLGRVLARMKRTTLREWQRALSAEGLSEAEYLRERALNEVLPWTVVHTGVSQSFLARDWQRAQANRLTRPCPPSDCTKCEACDEAWAVDALSL